MRMVPDVKEFRPEIQPHAFVGQREMLNEGADGINEPRPADRRARCVAKLSRSGRGEARRVKPLFDVPVAQLGIAGHVRPVETIAVPLEIHSSVVDAVYDEQWK